MKYEFECNACGGFFYAPLDSDHQEPSCPDCGSTDVSLVENYEEE